MALIVLPVASWFQRKPFTRTSGVGASIRFQKVQCMHSPALGRTCNPQMHSKTAALQGTAEHNTRSRLSSSTFWGPSVGPSSGVCAKQRRMSQGARRLSVTAVLKESQTLPMGTRAPDFKLPEPLTGRLWSLEDFVDRSGLLVMFISNHCPFVKLLKPSMKEIADEYLQKGLGVVAISSNSILTHPQDGPIEMAKEAQLFQYGFPYLYDEAQEVAKSYRAACTPDFYTFEKQGQQPFRLAYHGQWDDARPSNGKPVTGQDIRAALDLVVAGQPVSPLQRPSIGCNIKWHPGKEPEYF